MIDGMSKFDNKEQGKRLLKFGLLIVLTPIIAGIYGAIHNQVSSEISPEYFTKFKIHQFRLTGMYEKGINFNLIVGIIGFQATWTLGFPIGFLIGTMSFVRSRTSEILKNGLIGIATCIFTTFTSGSIGYIIGKMKPTEQITLDTSRYLFKYVEQKDKFYLAGSVHNAGYIGAGLGLIIGLIVVYNKTKTAHNKLYNP